MSCGAGLLTGVEFSERSLSLTSLMDFISLLSTLSIAFDFSFSNEAAAATTSAVLDDDDPGDSLSSSSGSDSQLRWW